MEESVCQQRFERIWNTLEGGNGRRRDACGFDRRRDACVPTNPVGRGSHPLVSEGE